MAKMFFDRFREQAEAIVYDAESELTEVQCEELFDLVKPMIGKYVTVWSTGCYSNDEGEPRYIPNPEGTVFEGKYMGLDDYESIMTDTDTARWSRLCHVIMTDEKEKRDGFDVVTRATMVYVAVATSQIDLIDPHELLDQERITRLLEEEPELIDDINVIARNDDLSVTEKLRRLNEFLTGVINLREEPLVADLCAYINHLQIVRSHLTMQPEYYYASTAEKARVVVNGAGHIFDLQSVTLATSVGLDLKALTESDITERIGWSLAIYGQIEDGSAVVAPLNQTLVIEEID